MAESKGTVSVTRVAEWGKRDATVLENGHSRILVDDQGGVVPEFSYHGENQAINAHWVPWFRSNPGRDGLVNNIAGNFPCLPNFGPDHTVDGVALPAHGWTANETWRFVNSGIDAESGAAWAYSTLESPDPKMPLSFKKIDALFPAEAVHYTAIRVINRGDRDLEIAAAWHNTVGAPFLQAGCRLSGAADRWATAPAGGEFDATTRLALGKEFPSLDKAPLAKGGTADISLVPSPLGYTDFTAGVIPATAKLGWSALVNPALKLAYICFFTGQAAAGPEDIILRFNELWMQYGGRRFTPWAAYEGGTDQTYCLGTENAISAYANGLEYSRKVKTLLGAPTTVIIPARSERVLRYGTLFAPYESALDEGIRTIEPGASKLVCAGSKGTWSFNADPGFGALKKLETKTASLG
ncbi:hypothetical protein [Treponema primitia]|uniref:hypothetical protein n=1 Tax=Treponema primitia TaxID=88058 RepID=UPI0002555665|nr:hypothetical protein [Treponema primitia]